MLKGSVPLYCGELSVGICRARAKVQGHDDVMWLSLTGVGGWRTCNKSTDFFRIISSLVSLAFGV